MSNILGIGVLMKRDKDMRNNRLLLIEVGSLIMLMNFLYDMIGG